MDDLSAKLSGILSDPQAMKEIAALASQLGVDTSGANGAAQPASSQPLNAEPSFKPQPTLDASLLNGLADPSALSMMSGLMPLLGSLKADDDTTRLLDAIRPFLSEERRTKLDRAKKLIRIMRLLPMLKGLNILDI